MTIAPYEVSMMVQVPIILRLAREDDLAKLEWHGQYKHYRQMYRRTFQEQQLGSRVMLLADSRGFPVGHIFIHLRNTNPSLSRGTPRAYFYSFRVMDSLRGLGIGTRLIKEAEALARRHGLAWASLAVAKENLKARQLYERLGYVVFADDPGIWSYVDHRGRLKKVNEPCWLLEKSL